jgi:hypothetical protein
MTDCEPWISLIRSAGPQVSRAGTAAVSSTAGTCHRIAHRVDAYRGGNCGDYPLLRDGKPVSFLKREDAQRVAEVHGRDSYPHAPRIEDGYFWPLDAQAKRYFEIRGELPEIDPAAVQQTRLWFPQAAGAVQLSGPAVVLFAT